MTDIVHYGPFYEAAHYQFAAKYWTKRKRLDSEYIYWKFRGNKGEPLRHFILAVEDEKVIGQLGLIPCSIMVENKKIEAQWACDLMVDKSYRGQGIAKLLYDYAYNLKPVTLGSDPSPAAEKSMTKAGFISLKGPTKFVFPMFIGEAAKLKGFNPDILNKIPNPFIFLLKAWSLLGKHKTFRPIKTNDFIEKTTRFADNAHEFISVIHDQNFAEWRFTELKNYYAGIKSYSNNLNSHYSVNKNKDVYLVTTCIADCISSYINIISSLVLDARKNNVKNIKLMANTKLEKSLFLFLGFIPFRTKTNIIFFCFDSDLKQRLTDKKFYYTFMDSDENI